MKAIYKTPLEFRPDRQVVEVMLPPGAKPLALQLQNFIPTVWWLVEPRPIRFHDPAEDEVVSMEKVRLRVVGTGHHIEDRWVYVGTWQMNAYVWHAFII